MRRIANTLAITLAALMIAAVPAFALSLDEARKSGKVGEQTDGYVAALNAASDVVQLVADVNSKRTAEYTRIAKENGQSVAVVGKLAAPKIINGLPSGALYQDNSGAWKTR